MKINYKILLISVVMALATTFLGFYPYFENIEIIPVITSIITLIMRNFILIYFLINYSEKIILIFSITATLWIINNLIITLLGMIIAKNTDTELIASLGSTFFNYLVVVVSVYFIILFIKRLLPKK